MFARWDVRSSYFLAVLSLVSENPSINRDRSAKPGIREIGFPQVANKLPEVGGSSLRRLFRSPRSRVLNLQSTLVITINAKKADRGGASFDMRINFQPDWKSNGVWIQAGELTRAKSFKACVSDRRTRANRLGLSLISAVSKYYPFTYRSRTKRWNGLTEGHLASFVRRCITRLKWRSNRKSWRWRFYVFRRL